MPSNRDVVPEFRGTLEECIEYARQKLNQLATCEVVHPSGATEIIDVEAR